MITRPFCQIGVVCLAADDYMKIGMLDINPVFQVHGVENS